MADRAVVAGLMNYEDCILYLLAYRPKTANNEGSSILSMDHCATGVFAGRACLMSQLYRLGLRLTHLI